MFTLVIVVQIGENVSWKPIEAFATVIPRRETIKAKNDDKEIAFKCTVKRNSKGCEMLAASCEVSGIRSRIIFRPDLKTGCVDFPRRNLRAWVKRNGGFTLKPIIKEKPIQLESTGTLHNLAWLHLRNYLQCFSMQNAV